MKQSQNLSFFSSMPSVFQLSVQNTGSTALEEHTQSGLAASAFAAYHKLKAAHTEGKIIKLSSSVQRFGKEHYKRCCSTQKNEWATLFLSNSRWMLLLCCYLLSNSTTMLIISIDKNSHKGVCDLLQHCRWPKPYNEQEQGEAGYSFTQWELSQYLHLPIKTTDVLGTIPKGSDTQLPNWCPLQLQDPLMSVNSGLLAWHIALTSANKSTSSTWAISFVLVRKPLNLQLQTSCTYKQIDHFIAVWPSSSHSRSLWHH